MWITRSSVKQFCSIENEDAETPYFEAYSWFKRYFFLKNDTSLAQQIQFFPFSPKFIRVSAFNRCQTQNLL